MIFVFPAFTLSFLLHCFFPSQEPPDTFLNRFSNDYKVTGIKVLSGDPRAELVWQGFKRNDEEQQAEYRVFVNTKSSPQTLHCTPHKYWHGSAYWHTSPVPVAQSTPSFFSQRPPDDLSRYSIKSLLQVYKSHVESLVGSWIHSQLRDYNDCICCASAWDKARLGIIHWHQLSDEAVNNPLQDFHDLLYQLLNMWLSPFSCILLTLVEADNKTLLTVREYPAIAIDCSCKATDLRGTLVIRCLYHLHRYAWWAKCFPQLHLRESWILKTTSLVIGIGGPSAGGSLDR